jgi:hypothetical protein
MQRSTTHRARSAIWLLTLLASVAAAGCQSLRAGEAPSTRWAMRLPACPCRQPQPKALRDGWAVDRVSSLKQHRGAAQCFRSYPPVRTEAGRSGQQCCYDIAESLVTSGSAAGTPDRATSCNGERVDGRMKVRPLGFVSHVLKDVRPWARRYRSWKTYHAQWPPDNGNACPTLHIEVQDSGALFSWREQPDETAWWSDEPRQVSSARHGELPDAGNEVEQADFGPAAS